MKDYLLIIFTDEFMKEVNGYITEFWDFSKDKISTKHFEEYKEAMWKILKQWYQHQREELPSELGEMLPPTMQLPRLTLVSKKAKGLFSLSSGHQVPMFNYKGEVVNAGKIPHILAVIGERHSMHYTGEGILTHDSKANELIKNMKDFNKN